MCDAVATASAETKDKCASGTGARIWDPLGTGVREHREGMKMS